MAARILGSYGVSSLAWCTLTDEQSKVSILTSSLGCWKRRTLSSPSIWHTIIWSLTSAMFVPLGESFGEHIAFTPASDELYWSYLHRSAGVSWFFFNNNPSFGVNLTNMHFFLGMCHFRSKFFAHSIVVYWQLTSPRQMVIVAFAQGCVLHIWSPAKALCVYSYPHVYLGSTWSGFTRVSIMLAVNSETEIHH